MLDSASEFLNSPPGVVLIALGLWGLALLRWRLTPFVARVRRSERDPRT